MIHIQDVWGLFNENNLNDVLKSTHNIPDILTNIQTRLCYVWHQEAVESLICR